MVLDDVSNLFVVELTKCILLLDGIAFHLVFVYKLKLVFVFKSFEIFLI